MKVKAVRSFLIGIDDDGNRDVIEAGEIRDISEKQFKEHRIHGLVEITEDEAKGKKSEKKS